MKKLKPIFLFLFLLVASLEINAKGIYHKDWIDFNKNNKKDIFEDKTQPVEQRVADLLSQMTLNEKTVQLATAYGYGRYMKEPMPVESWKDEIWKDGIANIDEQHNGVGRGLYSAQEYILPFSKHSQTINETQKWFIEQTRLGIPVDFSTEGMHGLNHSKATALPAPISMGSTWNPELNYRAGVIMGTEARALGYTNVYAPILDIGRDPRWGRIVETYSEDPYIVARMGAEMTKGIQSQNVASTLKHYAVYGVPKGGRDGQARTDPHVSPREMHELHLYPFRKVISEAKPMGLMSSYNDWNGEVITTSHYFMTELLRDTYGFDGYVVSDSGGVEFVKGKHQVASSEEEVAKQVLEAGLNVRTNFSSPTPFVESVRAAVKNGILSEAVVDKRVSEVLSVKFRLGLFDSPYVEDPALADQIVGSDKQVDFIKEVQRQALVLLKNEGALLPLDKAKVKNVAVIGPLADEDDFMTSRYGPNLLETVTVLKGMTKYLAQDAKVSYALGCTTVDENWPDSEIVPTKLSAQEQELFDQAVAVASASDVIIAVLGEDDKTVGESRTRTSLNLPGRQQLLLEALHATGKPVVLVLINGRPLTINWADRNIPAIMEAWFPGHLGGEVIAETLFGDNNPGGKLAHTFPKSVGQVELNFPYKKGSHGGQPKAGPNGSGTTRVVGELYPFGYGLSYTSFEYANLDVQKVGAEVRISLDVKNTGQYKGDEIVQLYLRDRLSSVVTYDSILRGFSRITLEEGETKRVSFTVVAEDIEILDKDMNWTAEEGLFEVCVGASSQDIRLRGEFIW